MGTFSIPFVAAAGSVTGRGHRAAERDGQDGYGQVSSPEVSAVVVTDGCSSGRGSEIGAKVGAAWLAALIEQRFAGIGGAERAAAAAREITCELIARLEVLARSMHPAGELDAARIADCLLFSFLAAVVTRESAIVFGVGDGTVLVGDELRVLDPGPENAPLCAGYALVGKRVAPAVHFCGRADDVSVLAVATDGLVPARELQGLAAAPRLETNPSLLRKRLLVLAGEHHFADDATAGVLRRIPADARTS